jgi:hypothetical protein
MSSDKKFGWLEFLTGFAAGSIAAILFTKKELKNDLIGLQSKALEIRSRLLSKAKIISTDLIERSVEFIESAKKFAEGKYNGTIESLENEYYSIKYGINAALENYRRNTINNNIHSDEDDLFIDFEDETSPKFLGMGRRKK